MSHIYNHSTLLITSNLQVVGDAMASQQHIRGVDLGSLHAAVGGGGICGEATSAFNIILPAGMQLRTFGYICMQASSLYMAVSGANVWSNQTWRAPMSACILSALLVLGFNLFSCVTLIK